jgi:hypothetical protein
LKQTNGASSRGEPSGKHHDRNIYFNWYIRVRLSRTAIVKRPDKPIEFMGSSLKALRGFPVKPRWESGYALQLAQWGERHPDAKPLRGYNGAGVIELVDSFDTDTTRQ